MVDTEGHKEEMLKLIMEENAQLREMEEKMDKMIKIEGIECAYGHYSTRVSPSDRN